MSTKSKWFVVATEGATADGRNIERKWLEEMAVNYDPTLYGARVNLEHFKGIFPDGDFKRLGDVLALKTEERDGKLRLLAQIEPTKDLIEMVKNKQKVYTSIEVNPNFADLNSAYLVGLAVTDDPASLGTEMLAFSAQAKKNPLAHRKQDKDNLFSEAIEFTLELEEQEKESLLDKLKAMFTTKTNSKQTEQQLYKTLEDVSTLLTEQIKQAQEENENLTQQLNELSTANIALTQQLQALEQKITTLEKEPIEFNRPVITGAEKSMIETDC
ncbi:GPO family capsid scaffolding protein [Gallibacterium genomosp. 1]|uniref:Precorrin-8W decarboxylase n=1 Tax=Gallibacterium genomosp. 1 TaxID=155515 RepID=A0A0A2YHG7_9PAST|nr:GPO family capsid scaffolding protein [Gallibacterium genomosp. 1]KGQ36799.1 hypothetical protein JP36_08720 [Gallibacterium genomosp. 1]